MTHTQSSPSRGVRRALISVYDKTGVIAFAKVLHALGIEILSTGGTAKVLSEAQIPVIDVATHTGAKEMLGGRVKTLHPTIHGGILYVRGDAVHEQTIADEGIAGIDLVVVNLYPFVETLKKEGVTPEEIIEQIDIGGVSLIRSAAKNYAAVTVVVEPADYDEVIAELKKNGNLTVDARHLLAGKAFGVTAQYDTAIAAHFSAQPSLAVSAPLVQALRYGENPHQQAALYGKFTEYYEQLHGKELSYNNILDLTAAADLCMEFADDIPTVVILKHMNPCGVGKGATLTEAWERAFSTDTKAPFGGIIAVNTTLDESLAELITEIFSEVIIAPSYTKQALELLKKKKNLRLMQLKKDPRDRDVRIRSVGAESYITQTADVYPLSAAQVTVVTRRHPTPDEMSALLFAFKMVHHIKSNAVVFANGVQSLGVGAGQMSRIDSTRIAVMKAADAGLSLAGSVFASDAFFPFPDALIAAVEAGAVAIIQPGGSVKDVEVIAAADERGIAMVFTGVRHFKH